MKQILAFGDSNTWGMIPGTTPPARYAWGKRWTSILQERLSDVRVIEEGLCGRTTVFEDELRPDRRGIDALPLILESHSPLDAVILMLGTNDCKSYFHASPYIIGKGIESCLEIIEKKVDISKVLLVSPLHLGEEVWKPEMDPEFSKESIIVSQNLKSIYQKIALKKGCQFLAASDYVNSSSIDNEHMDADSHEIFANAIIDKLTELGLSD